MAASLAPATSAEAGWWSTGRRDRSQLSRTACGTDGPLLVPRLPRAGGLPGSLEQVHQRHPEGLREPLQHADRRIVTASLELVDVLARDPGPLREGLLRQLARLPRLCQSHA